jgi:hypothetical protein
LPPHLFALDGGEGVGLRDTLHEKREKGFSFFFYGVSEGSRGLCYRLQCPEEGEGVV